MAVLIDRQSKVQVVDMQSERGMADRLRRQIRAVLDGQDLATEAIAAEQKKPSPPRLAPTPLKRGNRLRQRLRQRSEHENIRLTSRNVGMRYNIAYW